MNRNDVKVTFVGDAHVGKTSITKRIVMDRFNPDVDSTIGAAFCAKTIDGTKYNIWDCAGQARFNQLLPLYLRDVRLVVLVFDITNRESFMRIKEHWIPQVKKETRGDFGPILVVVGNKSDMQKGRQVFHEEITEMIDMFGTPYYEVSAKTGDSIKNLIAKMTEIKVDPKPEDQTPIINLKDVVNNNSSNRLFSFASSYCSWF